MEHHARPSAPDDRHSPQRPPHAHQNVTRPAHLDDDIERSLAELQAHARRGDAPAVLSALDAASFAVEEWVRHRQRAEAHHAALADASRRADEAAERAMAVLRMVREISALYEDGGNGPSREASSQPHSATRWTDGADVVVLPTMNAAAGQTTSPVPIALVGSVATPGSSTPTERAVEVADPVAGGTRDERAEGVVDARLLGAFALFVDGRRIEGFNGTRGPAVLQYLLTHRRAPVGREALVEAIWPELRIDDGRRRLHQAVYSLRQTLSQSAGDALRVDFVGIGYRLVVGEGYRLIVDADRFDEITEEIDRALRGGRTDDWLALSIEADALYGGDLLADAPWAEWAVADADRLRLRSVALANALGDHLLACGRPREALDVFERARRRDPWNEESTRGAMRAYDAIGQPSVVRRLFRAYCEQLERDLGVEPTPETRRLYAELSAGAA